jgi:hypothetical protein
MLEFFQVLVFPFLILGAILFGIQVILLLLVKKGKLKRFSHIIEDPDKMYELVAVVIVVILIIAWIWSGSPVENSGF